MPDTTSPTADAPAPALRLARAGDADLVRRISAQAYTPAYLDVIGAVPKPATEDYAGRIATGGAWILEDSGEAIGVLVLEPAADHLAIYSVAVLPSAQGRGLGKALLAFAGDLARRRGLPELRLYTNARMTKNLALYRGAGFVETGRRPHPSRAGEVLVDLAKRVV